MPKLFHTLCCCIRPSTCKKSDSECDANNAASSIITQVNKGGQQQPTGAYSTPSEGGKKLRNKPHPSGQQQQQQQGGGVGRQQINSPTPVANETLDLRINNTWKLGARGQKDYRPQESLLPRPHSHDHHKRTLIVDLDETLVHSSFKPVKNADFIIPVEIDNVVHQVYVLKRPYTDEFLERVGMLFECVLFTASLAKYADPVADLLDRRNIFRTRLFREACVFSEGNYVKDLDRLGRELEKVIIIDNSPASYSFHPDNAIPVRTWFDDPHDQELLELIPLLEELADPTKDIYSVLGTCPPQARSPMERSAQMHQLMGQQPPLQLNQLNNNTSVITQVSSPNSPSAATTITGPITQITPGTNNSSNLSLVNRRSNSNNNNNNNQDRETGGHW